MAKKVLKKAEQGTSTPKLKPGQVTARRAYAMSDSLNKSAGQISRTSERIADRISSVRKDEARNKPAPTIYMTGIGAAKRDSTLTGSKDMEKYTKDAPKVANANREKADRLKSRADDAMSAAPKKKMGGMIKRADGSTSQRGLWDNIRANKGSEKKPTSAMLKQEKKIKAKKAKDGDTVEKGITRTGEVTKRLGFGEGFRGDMRNSMTTDSTDYQNTKAKTTAGKVLRGANKVASTVARGVMAPVAATASAIGSGIKAGVNAIKNRQDLNKIPKQKMGGKVMMKTKKK